MVLRKSNKDNQRLAALQRTEKPTELVLSCYRFDSNRIMDIIAMAARLGVSLNRTQAVRYAIRFCPLNESTAADFAEILNEDTQRLLPKH